VNLALLVLQIYYHFIGNIWIIFAIILFEGLLGGAAYVNSFYQISKNVITSCSTVQLLIFEQLNTSQTFNMSVSLDQYEISGIDGLVASWSGGSTLQCDVRRGLWCLLPLLDS